MSTPRNIVKNIRSNSVGTNGKPKLPTPNQLDYGEIAVNYKEGYETLSLKNDGDKIVSLSVNSVEDVKVNGSTVVSKSNKTAEITMKGDTIPVSGRQYSPMTYPKPFDGKAQLILATDMMDDALKTLETNISALVTEVLDNEETSAAAIRKLAESAGTVDGSGNIGYQQTGLYSIKDATSVHDATVKLDSEIYGLGTRISSLQTTINNLQEIINQNSTVEWVDLGLSVKWAKCNVGAKNETDYGSYFQWGDIINKTNSNCDWPTYKYCNGGQNTLTKYNNNTSYGVNPDNITTLEPEDDAATQIMGGNWRTPTQTELQELLEKTDNQWVTNYKGSGVNGYKFTHKTDTSKYIFIPASGFRSVSSFDDQGTDGLIWSSSLFTSNPNYALLLGFNSGSAYANNYYNRSYGFVVRGVCTLPL